MRTCKTLNKEQSGFCQVKNLRRLGKKVEWRKAYIIFFSIFYEVHPSVAGI